MFKKRSINFLLLTLIIVGFIFSAWRRIQAYPTPWWLDNDFAHYYVTSWLLGHGFDPYTQTSPIEVSYRLGFHPTTEMSLTNPPALAVLFLPLTLLPPFTAFLIWLSLQIISFLFCWGWLENRCSWNPGAGYKRFFFLAAITSAPVFFNIKYGQCQLLILALTLLGIESFLQKRHRLGSFILGISVSLKLFTWPVLLLPLLLFGIGNIMPLIAGLALLTAPAALMAGVEVFQSFLTHALPFVMASAFSFSANESIPAAIAASAHALGWDGATLSKLVRASLALVALCWIRIAFKSSSKLQEPRRQILYLSSLLLLGSCLFSPTTWPHYLVLLLPALFYASSALQMQADTLGQHLLALVSICLGCSIGIIPGSDALTYIVSAWWGFASMAALAAILFRSLRSRS